MVEEPSCRSPMKHGFKHSGNTEGVISFSLQLSIGERVDAKFSATSLLSIFI